MWRFVRLMLGMSALTAFVTVTLWAQATAQISGTMTDATGTRIPESGMHGNPASNSGTRSVPIEVRNALEDLVHEFAYRVDFGPAETTADLFVEDGRTHGAKGEASAAKPFETRLGNARRAGSGPLAICA